MGAGSGTRNRTATEGAWRTQDTLACVGKRSPTKLPRESNMSRWLLVPACLGLLAACALSVNAETVAKTVYGKSITKEDVEQRSRLNLLTARKEFTTQDVTNQLA